MGGKTNSYMKKILLVVFIFCLSTNKFYGQKITVGPAVGFNHTTIDLKQAVTKEGKLYNYAQEEGGIGIVAGGFAKINFGNMFIQPQMLYSQERTNMILDMNGNQYLQTVTINNFNIPVLFGMDLMNNCAVMAGPVFSAFIDGSILPSRPQSMRINQYDNNVTFGYQFGVGFTQKRSTLTFKYRGFFKGESFLMETSTGQLNFDYNKTGIQLLYTHNISK